MVSLVYIIVPVYNMEKYVSRCLDSIFAQTYKKIHVIVVNDGSTDKSYEILLHYKNIYNNINVINKDNGGLSSARNAALAQIKDYDNNFIMFVDADDYLKEDYVEKMMGNVIENKNNIICSNFTGFNDNSMVHLMYVDKKNYIYKKEEALKDLFRGKLLSQAQTKLFSACLWRNTFFNESVRFMEDQEIMFKMFYKTDVIYYEDYPGYYYYYSDNSLVRSAFSNRKVLDSLYAYYQAIIFDYSGLEDKEEIIKYAKDCFASNYLMMLPRFYKNMASKEELSKFNFYKQYVKRNKIIKYASTYNEKDKKKRMLYLVSPLLYIFLYRKFIQNKDKKR